MKSIKQKYLITQPFNKTQPLMLRDSSEDEHVQ